ncbi:hypothetical protein ScPMuIL_012719 [Solemya velum]
MERNNNVVKSKSVFCKGQLRNNEIFVWCFTAVVASLCYLNSISGDFVHDDIFAITSNSDVTGKNPLFDVFKHDFWGRPMSAEASHKSYRPLCILTFRLNYAISTDPLGFHVVNIILHALVTFLVAYVCRSILFLSVDVSLMAGLLFAVHPVHTEAVSGIVGRADLLAAVLFLLSFICYTRSLDVRWLWYEEFPKIYQPELFFCSLLLAGAAMLCKEHGLTVFGLCILYDAFVCCRRGLSRMLRERSFNEGCLPLVRRLIVVTIVVTALMSFRIWIMDGTTPSFIEQDNPASFSPYLLTRCLTYSYLWVFNAWLLLAPITLCYDWQIGSIPLVESISDCRNLATIAFFFVAVCFFIRCYRCFQANVQTPLNTIISCLLLVIMPFLPASNLFFRVGFVVAERILYIPSIGFCIGVAYGIHMLLAKYRHYRPIIIALFVCLFSCLVLKTWQQNKTWLSRESLFRSGVSTLPHNAKAHYNYANYLKDSGQNDQAAIHYHKALDLYPNHPSAHNNLGTLLSLTNPRGAEFHFREAIRLLPNHRSALRNLGSQLFNNNHKEEGIQIMTEALNADPYNLDVLMSLADMMVDVENWSEAERYYQAVMQEKPDFANAYNNFGAFLFKRGNIHESLDYYHWALELDSTHTIAMVNAAKSLRQLGRNGEAENMYKQALSVRFDVGTADQMALFYYKSGRISDALSVFEQLQISAPNDTNSKLHHAQVLANANDFDKAESLLLEILQYEPDHLEALRQVANVLGVKGRHKQAVPYQLAAIETARSIESADVISKLYFDLGNHYKDAKMYLEALKSYNESLQFDEDQPRAYLNIGAVYHLQGDLISAAWNYEKVLSKEPDNTMAKDNLKKAKRLLQKKSGH